MDLITNLKLKPGDVIEIKSRVTVVDSLIYNEKGRPMVSGTVANSDKRFKWCYEAMDSVAVVSRSHPEPKHGDVWQTREHSAPAFFYNGQFRFPSGIGHAISNKGVLTETLFFDAYPDAKLLFNVFA